MPFRTRLTERLGIRHPVLLAPMALVSGGALAGAVTAAGGLGIIGGGYGNADWLEQQFAAAGNQRVGCGFITWSLAKQPALLDRVLAHRPVAVMLSFGDPAPFVAKIRASKATLICQVQTVAMAREAAKAGADIIIAQGSEAGGHGATRGTLPLVPAVRDATATEHPDCIVVAAGGIGDGRGVAAALTLGAEGVLIGTRFYAATESLAHSNGKARMVAASGDQTYRTSLYDVMRRLDWPEVFTARILRNAFSRRWRGDEAGLLESEEARYHAAVTAGDFEIAPVYAGEGVDLVRDILPAADIMARLVAEAEAALDRANGFIA
jgi:nitronate monooxygenase